MLFEHLVDADFTEVDKVTPQQLVDAQVRTLDFFSDEDMATAQAEAKRPKTQSSARAAFNAMVQGNDITTQREKVLALTTPSAVRHLVGMLSAYDWEFVNHAKQLRGYVVAKLLDETSNDDARIRLRALELVGKLTEVGSFTERVEVINKNESSSEIQDKIRAKLATLLPKEVEIETVTPKNANVNP